MHTDLRPDLHLDHMQRRICQDRMRRARGHLNDIPWSNPAHFAIHDCPSLSINYRPHLIPQFMAVVIHAVARIQGYLDCHTLLFDIDHLETAP